jgi:hypothetical protein
MNYFQTNTLTWEQYKALKRKAKRKKGKIKDKSLKHCISDK